MNDFRDLDDRLHVGLNMFDVLIAEDDKDLRRIVKLNLESKGFKVRTARNGKLVLKKVQEKIPDCLILDVMMPELDGFEVCKRIKTMDRTRDIPVIFLTAKGETNDKLEGMGLDADEYMTKPFDFKELIARINHLISKKETKVADIERAEEKSEKEIVAELSGKLSGPLNDLKENLAYIINIAGDNPEVERYVKACEEARRLIRQVFIETQKRIDPFYEPEIEEELIEI
ncbi:response regulator [bacterium]|nr:response regulator [bacterium]